MIRKYHARCGAGEKIENHRFKVLPIAIMNIVGDISIPHGYIGIPWQAILKLYEPFTEYQILKNPYNANVKELIKKYMDISNNLTSSDLKRFLTLINEQPENVNPELVDELVRIAEDVTKGKLILNKRDPVENRNSYIASYIRVDRDSLVIKLNPLDCPRLGADYDGDTVALFPLFSKKANDEAREKMNPITSSTMWNDPAKSGKVLYDLKLDATAIIYTATKR